MAEDWRVSVGEGKYTAIAESCRGLTFLRHGEPWPAAEDLRFANVVHALAAELRQARRALLLVMKLGREPADPDLLEGAVGFHADYGVGFVDFALELERREALQKSEGPIGSNSPEGAKP